MGFPGWRRVQREKPEKLGPLPSPEAVAMACGRFLIAGRLERTAGDTAC